MDDRIFDTAISLILPFSDTLVCFLLFLRFSGMLMYYLLVLPFNGTLIQLEFSVMVQMIINHQSYNLIKMTVVRAGYHCHDGEIDI